MSSTQSELVKAAVDRQEITSLRNVFWFPDGKHLLLIGAGEGQPLRTYEMDLDGGKPQPSGPADFIRVAVSPDEKRIAGRHASGEAVVFDRDTQRLQAIPGIDPGEILSKWTEDAKALLVSSATTREAQLCRVEAETASVLCFRSLNRAVKRGR